MSRDPRRRYLPGAFCLAAAAAACQSEPERVPAPLRPVRYVEVHSTQGRRIRSFSGVAQADVESTLSFRVSGNLQVVHVTPGDRVEEGQIIAELDPRDFNLRVEEAGAALLQSQAMARQAEADYDRIRGLYENRNAAKSELDAGRAAAESARAQIDAAVQRLEQARAQLSYTRLQAPSAGQIARMPVDTNENIQAGQEVAMLTSGSRPEVSVALPESLIGEVRQGDRVTVTFDALPDRTFEAAVTELGVAAAGLATTFPVAVQVREETEDVRSGMAAVVAFVFGEQDLRPRFLVPPHSVVEDRQGRFVFVVEPAGTGQGIVKRKPVVIGELTGEGLEVLEGLVDGDRLVTAGVSQIQDGLRVKFDPEGASS